MVIDDFNLKSIITLPFKADPPLIIDMNRVLAGPIASQFL